ncbi:hypothetical protein OBBRIDRAFT_17368 [Obba rivulosa]|uniref:F-box domain-containing protein n=1 Tax=Obba rivulosa TaxID=1052685 RepID=A0A8E2J7L4_9APHY|nr:hypothetical protein OBBRIDRAFT_17368 [Obba rivulosa]
MHFTELSDDVIDHILTRIPDFKTYTAAIRASKQFYTVWNRHPKSTLRAVAWNVVGPALPSALRLVRFLSAAVHHGEDASSALKDEALLVHEDIETGHECRLLQHHAQVVQKLEDLFSRRNKDRMSPTSRLSEVESYRFHRAVYRFWLYVAYMKERRNQDDHSDDDNVLLPAQDELLDCAPLLDSFPSDELYEIDRVYSFLQETAQWILHAGLVDMFHGIGGGTLNETVLIYSGPETISVCLETRIMANNNVPLADVLGAPHRFFERPLGHVLEKRQISAAMLDERRPKAIIDSVIGEDDTCDACGAPEGTHLWGTTNWNLLKGYFPPRDMCNCLEANLPHNTVETRPLTAAMAGPVKNFDYNGMMEEMFGLEPDENDTWSKDSWYCLSCVKQLFRRRFRKWLFLWKSRTTGEVQEDCWYGYHCRTQMWKRAHAAKLNVSLGPAACSAAPGWLTIAASHSASLRTNPRRWACNAQLMVIAAYTRSSGTECAVFTP